MTTTNVTEPHPSPPSARSRVLSYLALAGSTVGIGSALIFVRLSQVDPTSTLMLRMAVASLIMGAMTATPHRTPTRLRSVSRRDLVLLVASSAVSCFDLLANQWSVHYTAVANTALLINLSPLFVLLLSWLIFRERISATKLLAVATALAGATLMVWGDAGQLALAVDRHLFGDLLAVTSAVLYAVYLAMTKDLRARLPASLIVLTNSVVITGILLPLAVATSDPVLPHNARGYALIITYALVAQLLGHGLMAYALRVVNVTFASLSALLRPIVTVILGWLILDEAVGALQILGGLVILGALAWFQFTGSAARTPKPATAPAD